MASSGQSGYFQDRRGLCYCAVPVLVPMAALTVGTRVSGPAADLMRASSRLTRFVIGGAATFAIAGGAVTLLGWAIDARRLTDWEDTGISMLPNTALCVAIAGVALALREHCRALLVCGIGIGLVGLSTLLQHLAGLDFGIDRLVFPKPWGQRGTVSPGRMGLPASTCFTILGTAFVCATMGRAGRQVAAIGGVLTASIAMLSLVGYLYGADTLYLVPNVTTIAMQTSTILLVLSVGLVAALPDALPMRALRGPSAAAMMVRRALPFALLLPVAIGWLRMAGENHKVYDSAFGNALRTLVECALLVGLLAWMAAAVRRHERSLTESRAKLEGLMGSVSDGFQAVDRVGRHTYLNTAMRRLLAAHGIDADALLGKPLLALYPRLREAPAAKLLLDAIERRVPVEFETEAKAWSRWFSVRASPTPDGGLAIVSQDITAKKQAEAALRLSEARLSGFLETAAICLHRVGPDGTILWANEAELTAFGYSREDYVGRHIADFHADAGVIADILARLHRGERLLAFPAQMKHRDGTVRDVVIDSSVLWDEGRFVHTQCFTRDVTEQKRLERELRARMQQLHETDRKKDEFLATLAHELRNPLAPIANMLEVIKRDGASGTMQQWCAMMERQLKHLTRLIDDLLDVSRISTGRIVLRPARVDLATVIDHARESITTAVQAAQHRLVVTLPREPVHLNADPIRIAQVLGNLLDNACKYTDAGGTGRIELTAERDGDHAVIRVRDNGVGIPPEMLTHVFEMFTRVQRSPAAPQEGLGIGLSLVKSLVELHGGTVTAHSDGLGKGSEIVVRLPALHVAAAAALTPPARPFAKMVKNCRILVVDDNRDAAATLARLLALTGNTMRTAADGLEAIAAAAEFAPDVILLDIGLPKLDGYEVARRLREKPAPKPLVIVAVTGWGQEQDRQMAKAAGFDGHLVKPLEPEALSRLLTELLPHLSPAR
jgi:PAS domain S-box-containing protein